MRLTKIKYAEYPDSDDVWSVDDTDLGQTNLFVAKNATGKTRMLNAISGISLVLSGQRKDLWDSCHYSVSFADSDTNYKYEIDISKKTVLREQLLIDDKIYLQRRADGSGEINAAELKKDMQVKVPLQQILVQRQDEVQHPFLQSLHKWAESVHHYQFGLSMGQEQMFIRNQPLPESITTKEQLQAANMFIAGKKEFNEEFIQEILTRMNELGYNLEQIDIGLNPKIKIPGSDDTPFASIRIKEGDRTGYTYQHEISTGMFRALSLFIQMTYVRMKRQASCIIIDDIGEGIDYERSVSLVKAVQQMTDGTNVQLIMATNNKFIMNSVGIENWQILSRDSGHCKVYNYKNSKDKFDEFLFTGLSNFDLLTSEFYEKGFSEA